MKTYWSIDRLENDIAVCISDGETEKNIPLYDFSFNVHEGMLLYFENNTWQRDEAEEKRRKAEAKRMADILFQHKK